MKIFAVMVILLILMLVLFLSLDKDYRNPTLVYRVLGKHEDGDGNLIYTVEVRNNHTEEKVFFGNIPASEYQSQPLYNNRWNLVPPEDLHIYLKKG